MFDLWPSGDANPIVKSRIGLIDVGLSQFVDVISEVMGKIGFVLSAEVLDEMILWGVLLWEVFCHWHSRNLSSCFFYLEFSHQLREYWFYS